MQRRAPTPLLPLLLGALLLAPAAGAQELDPVRYAVVKAGYVLNLLRLTQWPDTAFLTEDSPLVVHVVGEDAMTFYLEEVVREERVGNRPVIVRQLSVPDEPAAAGSDAEEQLADALRGAHLVFVADDALPHLESVLRAVAPDPVLTVSDIAAFAVSGGGMIGLVVRGEGTVGIEANVPRLERSGVSVSARVLQLARIVNE
jgi:hypothetical protein